MTDCVILYTSPRANMCQPGCIRYHKMIKYDKKYDKDAKTCQDTNNLPAFTSRHILPIRFGFPCAGSARAAEHEPSFRPFVGANALAEAGRVRCRRPGILWSDVVHDGGMRIQPAILVWPKTWSFLSGSPYAMVSHGSLFSLCRYDMDNGSLYFIVFHITVVVASICMCKCCKCTLSFRVRSWVRGSSSRSSTARSRSQAPPIHPILFTDNKKWWPPGNVI